VARIQANTFLPFLSWFKSYSPANLRHDLVAGVTVALVLVPQSMAYAQLAGLPAYYGLYAAFLPPLVASLLGSSRQLATGPVAVVSLMTATALEPLATAGSEAYIGYAILLALMVGCFQLLLGVFRLGLVVNFLSHPVVHGFTNAAALIIATSQLSKLFGVYVDKAEHHYETIYNVGRAAVEFIHWPTLALAILAFAIMIILRRVNRRIPNVLVAVAATTLISWLTGFEKNTSVTLRQVPSEDVVSLIRVYNATVTDLNARCEERVDINRRVEAVTGEGAEAAAELIRLDYELALVNIEIERLKNTAGDERRMLRSLDFCTLPSADGHSLYAPRDAALTDEARQDCGWRLKVGNQPLDTTSLLLVGGGAVVGNIPSGLPGFSVPLVTGSSVLSLLSMAMIISLLGFMEAISIAKAMAAKTGQRLDPNQELIGQGLSNMLGSFNHSYAVSGSFSRSAVNLQAGAVTGLSNVFSSLVVAVTLLLFTPLLYHLPQAVLAAIIMMAVAGLVNLKTFVHAWQAQKYDGAIGIITFIATLTFAPHLDRGILLGVGLSLILYLVRNTKPALALLSLHPDGTYRSRSRFDLEQCKHIAVVRYAGSLFFANVSYLEDQILDTVRAMPDLKHVILVGNGINELDASGEETLATLVERLHQQGYGVSMSGLNDTVIDVMRRTGLLARIGEENLHRNATRAIESVWSGVHKDSDERECPLKVVPQKRLPVAEKFRKARSFTRGSDRH
jgi:anti-anti-sigma factor